MSNFALKPQYLSAVHWWRRGSCGEPGCEDKECCCALCQQPIGVPEEDPRWDTHDEYCGDCELCRDQVPIILFRGEGKRMQQAQFHADCFEKIVHFRSGITAARSVNDAAPPDTEPGTVSQGG